MLAIDQQSPNIAAGVHVNRSMDDVGAGDQVCFVKQKNLNSFLEIYLNFYVGYCHNSIV